MVTGAWPWTRCSALYWCVPTGRMAEQGHDEQHREGRGEGMGIERQREPTLAHRPGGLRLVLMLPRVLVDLLGGIQVFRFRRAPLK
jgi:hypothetical protein